MMSKSFVILLLSTIIIIAIVVVVFIIYHRSSATEHFIPFNAFGKYNDEHYDLFNTLVNTLNSTEFSVPYTLNDVSGAFASMMNSTGLGDFSVVSIGAGSSTFSLRDVLIRCENTLQTARLSSVNVTVDSLDPSRLQHVHVVLDKNSLRPLPYGAGPVDELAVDAGISNIFRILNPYHLFYPYATSDDDMKVPEDVVQTAIDRSLRTPVISDSTQKKI